METVLFIKGGQAKYVQTSSTHHMAEPSRGTVAGTAYSVRCDHARHTAMRLLSLHFLPSGSMAVLYIFFCGLSGGINFLFRNAVFLPTLILAVQHITVISHKIYRSFHPKARKVENFITESLKRPKNRKSDLNGKDGISFSALRFKKELLHIIGEKEQERFCRDVCFSAHTEKQPVHCIAQRTGYRVLHRRAGVSCCIRRRIWSARKALSGWVL